MFKAELTPYERGIKSSGRFYLGGIIITSAQWRRMARRFVSGNIRSAKRRQHYVPAKAAAEMFPHLFGSSVGMVGLNYHRKI